MEHRRKAKSQGCHGAGTFRATATRGWRKEAFLGPLPSLPSLCDVFLVEWDSEDGEEDIVVMGWSEAVVGVFGRAGDDGTEEARL